MKAKRSVGAQNATTFREVILSSNKPLLSSCTFDGVIKEYYFETGLKETTSLLETAYSVGIDHNPMDLEKEIHLAIGLHSSQDGKNERHDLNLVIVLDISGSMSSGMSSKDKKSKMQVSKEALCDIIDTLKDFERIGIVLFNSGTSILQPLTLVQDLDRCTLKKEVMNITEGGGTDFSKGMMAGIQMYSTLGTDDPNSNRLIYLTDACPTIGGSNSLDVLTLNANIGPYKIYSTFIGVGLNFNTDIVSTLTRVRGCNYFSVNSNDEFKTVLKEDFNYTVSTICFNVTVSMESEDCFIESCYGSSPENSTDTLMKIDSCSAGPFDHQKGVKGGITLAKIKPKSNSPIILNLKLILTYEDSEGKKVQQEKAITIDTSVESDYYETSGVRKAIVLARYMNMIRLFASQSSILDWKGLYNYLEREGELLKEDGFSKELKIVNKCMQINQ